MAAAPFVGSLLGVLVTRLPVGRSVVIGRSACETCGHVLGVPDLIPVASYLALRGRCRFCDASIDPFHVWVELAALGVAAWAAEAGDRGASLWAGCALGWTLLTLAWIDARCLRLPDVLTLPLLLAGLAEAAWLEPELLLDRGLGAGLGATALWLLAWSYRRLRGREGLGLGDAKLLGAGGAWIGTTLLPYALLGAALGGIGWAWRFGRLDPGRHLPFGPFLAGGIWLAWLYG